MEIENIQTVKVALILCSCFFSYGIYWSNWAFDYYLLWANSNEHPEAISRAIFYYANQAHIPNILRYVPIANLCIAAAGFATGLLTMTDGNLLFDGASLVLLFFGITTHVTSVRPAVKIITNPSVSLEAITASLKNIAAAHFIIVLSITGIIGLQITHYFVIKRSNKSNNDNEYDDEQEEEEEEEDDEDEKKKITE